MEIIENINCNNNNNNNSNYNKVIIMETDQSSPSSTHWKNATIKPNTLNKIINNCTNSDSNNNDNNDNNDNSDNNSNNNQINNNSNNNNNKKIIFEPPTDIKPKFDKKNYLINGPKDEFDKEFLNGQKMTEDNKKKKKGIKIIKKLADKNNNVASQVWMAVYNIYDHTNSKKDIKEGFKYAKKAADQGHFKGLEIVGSCYRLGKGVPVDNWKAIDCLRMSSELGNANASHQLGVLYWRGDPVVGDKDMVKSFEYFLLAANQNYCPISVAECYFKGEGTEINYMEALKWFYIASHYGETKSFIYLADIYYNGYGVDQDYNKAFEYYTKAESYDTLSSNGNCLNSIGICYLRGHGVQQNLDTAISYFKKSISKGNLSAQKNLDSVNQMLKEKLNSRKSYSINIYN